MSDYIFFLITGLGTGALYAALGQGLVIAYKGSAVVNFAHGALASYSAYVFMSLRNEARMPMPPLPNPLALVEGVANWFRSSDDRVDLPSIPTWIDLPGDRLPTWMALAGALAVAALLGLLMHVLVFRPLRSAPPLAKVVAAVGVMLLLQQVIVLRYGPDARNVAAILPNRGVELPGLGTVGLDRLLLAAIAVVLGAILVAFFHLTRQGRAIRAATESEKGAILLGFSPDRLAAITWVLAALVAALVGILAAPIAALTPTNYTEFLIPAFGAALLAGLNSLAIVTLAGLALGMVDNLFVHLQVEWSWLPEGTRQAVPFVVIILVMILRGRSLPDRGALQPGRLPEAPAPRRVVPGVLIGVVVMVPALIFLPFDWRQALTISLIALVVSLGLVVLTGFLGQLSLAQMSMAGAAAVVLTRTAGQWGVPFPIGPLMAITASVLVGVLVGIPALRVRGANLAIVTLGFAVAFQAIVLDNREVLAVDHKPPAPSLFGIDFGPLSDFPIGGSGIPSPAFGLFVFVVALLVVVAVANLRRSDVGREMLAVRGNERAAAAAGVNVVATKLVASGVASFAAGTAGVLLTYSNLGNVNRDAFVVLISVSIFATAYLGGISTVGGAMVAGLIAVGGVVPVAFEKMFHLGRFEQFIAGLALVFTAVRHPEGIAGAGRHAIDALRRGMRGRMASASRNVGSGLIITTNEARPRSARQVDGAVADGLPQGSR